MSVKGNLHSLRKYCRKCSLSLQKYIFCTEKCSLALEVSFWLLKRGLQDEFKLLAITILIGEQGSVGWWRIRWLLDSHAQSKFAAKCRIAWLQAKNRKKDPKIGFHKFPDDATIRRAWIHAVRPCPNIHVCVRSTSKRSYLVEVKLMGSSNSTKSLKTGAIPTLFSHKPPKGGRGG